MSVCSHTLYTRTAGTGITLLHYLGSVVIPSLPSSQHMDIATEVKWDEVV